MVDNPTTYGRNPLHKLQDVRQLGGLHARMCTVCFSAKDSHFWAQASAKLLFFRGEVALNKAIPRKLSPWRFSVGKLLVEESTERAPQKYKRRGSRGVCSTYLFSASEQGVFVHAVFAQHGLLVHPSACAPPRWPK